MKVYVFVDESPSHAPEGRYIVGGCWFLSKYNDDARILQSTLDKLRHNVEGTSGTLKGESTSESVLDDLFRYIRSNERSGGEGYLFGEDDSVFSDDLPWMHKSPIGFNFYDSHAKLGKELVDFYLGSSDATTQQVFALFSLITPVFSVPRQTTESISEVVVTLDADTWERPATTLRSELDTESVRFITKPDTRFREYSLLT